MVDTTRYCFLADPVTGVGKGVKVNPQTGALAIVSYNHHEIHAGSHYFVSSYFDLAINHVLDFSIVTPNTTKWAHFTWLMEAEAETNWLLYEGAVLTNPLSGTITPINNNRNSSNVSGLTIKYEDQATLVAANADTDVSGATILASGIIGAKQSGGSEERENEIMLKQNTNYCLRIIATAAGFVDYRFNWYEHTNI